ncbi:MAG: peptidase, partial [Vicinamibacterales bacterium]
PYPIAPQEWRFSRSIDYSMSFNRAVIDYAARNREHLLFNIYRMGQRAIERGSGDYWTPSPSRINAVGATGGRGEAGTDTSEATWASLRKPELRDPRAFIIPSDQPDFPTATQFINALREVNVAVQRATRPFTVNGKTYPTDSYVVFTAQAFRPHVMDMFEPQDHPNVIPYPGAPPTPPYDNAGWTLAFQMGVKFDRILEPFSGPFKTVTEWNAAVRPGTVHPAAKATGYTLSRRSNNAFRAVNRLLAMGESVRRVDDTFLVGAGRPTRTRLEHIAAELGVDVQATNVTTIAGAEPVRARRVGLWDQYGGSMPAGWTRWILEQFEFPFSRVFAQELDAGNLNARYDVLIFVDGAIPAVAAGGRGGRGGGPELTAADVPAEYRTHLGRMTADRTIPNLRAFVEAGGTIVTIGSSAENLAAHFTLPIEDHLVEDGKPLPRSKYFVPGSVLTATVDIRHPVAAGMEPRTDFFFDNSPVFRIRPGAEDSVRAIATFDTDAPLHSGWAWGQRYLKGGVIAAEARVGKGRVLLFGPEILQRAQPHGTFKLLFNAIFQG